LISSNYIIIILIIITIIYIAHKTQIESGFRVLANNASNIIMENMTMDN